MSGLDSSAPPLISVAPSGRASCRCCKELIAQGAQRVSMVGRGSGVSQYKHAHPSCFVSGTLVDYAPTGAARCKADGSSIARGEVRLRLRLVFQQGCCEEMVGQAKEQQIYKVVNAAPLLRKYLELDGVTLILSSIAGISELHSEHRQWVIDALEGRDVSKRPVPVFVPPAKKATKSKPTKEPPATKFPSAPAAEKTRVGKTLKPIKKPLAAGMKRKHADKDVQEEQGGEEEVDLVD